MNTTVNTTYHHHGAPQAGEIQNYVRQDLAAQAAAKAEECRTLLSRLRMDRTVCFALHTALELYAIERPRRCRLPTNDFYITTRDGAKRSTLKNVSYRAWNHPYTTFTFSNGLTCMHPTDVWVHYAQYLDVEELVVLGESIIRRYGYSLESFRDHLKVLGRVTGRARCERALELIKQSDSVQETRARLTLLRFGLPEPIMHHIVTVANGVQYTVDMAYPTGKVAVEYDGDHHRRFRSQYVRDQRKRRELRAAGWVVIEVFADDLWNESNQRDFAQHVANALKTPMLGLPKQQYRALTDPAIAINARKGEYHRRMRKLNEYRASPHRAGTAPTAPNLATPIPTTPMV